MGESGKTEFGVGFYIFIGFAVFFIISIWAGYFFRIPLIPLIELVITFIVFMVLAFWPRKSTTDDEEETDKYWWLRFFILLFTYAGGIIMIISPVLWLTTKIHSKKL